MQDDKKDHKNTHPAQSQKKPSAMIGNPDGLLPKSTQSVKLLWAGTSLSITHKRQRRIEDWFPN